MKETLGLILYLVPLDFISSSTVVATKGRGLQGSSPGPADDSTVNDPLFKSILEELGDDTAVLGFLQDLLVSAACRYTEFVFAEFSSHLVHLT